MGKLALTFALEKKEKGKGKRLYCPTDLFLSSVVEVPIHNTTFHLG